MERPTTYRPALAPLFSLLLIASVSGAQAQTKHSVDLAQNRDGQLSETVDAGSYRVVITNKLPTAHYDIKCIRSIQEIDEFPLNALQPIQENHKGLVKDACDTLQQRIKSLDALSSESVLADSLEAIRKDLNDTKSGCSLPTRTAMLKQVELRTEFTLNETFQLNEGEELTIVVSRVDGDKTHTWTHVLTTRARGRWYVTYGFSFVTDLLNKEETYFAKQQPDTTLYTITKKNPQPQLTFVPSVMFHWVPTKKANKNWVPSVTGGLGFDLESPVVFLGGSLIYNSNLGIHIGLAAQKQNRLNGIYSPGDTVKENLTEDQLNEKAYAVNPFISISFRFKSSPFANP